MRMADACRAPRLRRPLDGAADDLQRKPNWPAHGREWGMSKEIDHGLGSTTSLPREDLMHTPTTRTHSQIIDDEVERILREQKRGDRVITLHRRGLITDARPARERDHRCETARS